MKLLFHFDVIETCLFSCRIIYDRFSCNDQNTKDNMTGIQILGALLASGLQPYCSNTDVLEEKYERTKVLSYDHILC